MGDSPELGILAITDLHYVGTAEHVCTVKNRHSTIGALLVRKALRKAQCEGLRVDLIVILGDVVDDGAVPGAADDLRSVFEVTRKAGLPVLAVCGNHDENPAEFLSDSHLHSQYAYCAKSVNIEDDIKIARLMGLRMITITEHAFHLYFPNKEAWSYKWQEQPEMRREAYVAAGNRMGLSP